MNASEPFDLPEWFRRQNFEQRIYSNKKLSKWKLVLRAESSVHIFFIPSSYSSSSLAYQPKEWTSFFVGHRARPIDTLSHHCALYLVPKLHLPSLEATRELLAPIHIPTIFGRQFSELCGPATATLSTLSYSLFWNTYLLLYILH